MKVNAHTDDSLRNHTWRDVCVFAAMIVVFSFGMHERAEGADGTSSSVSQDFTTVQELYESCTASQHSYTTLSLLSKCRGYINGVADMMVLFGTEGDATTRKYFGMCPKDIVTQGAVIQVFKNWAEKHPEMWGKPSLLGVMMALNEAWQCN